MAVETLEPRPDNPCFGCGADNPRGMKLVFELDHDARKVSGRFRLGLEYQGANRILHGGIIALLFDEAMGKLNRLHGVRAVTAELNVKYLRPVPVDAEIIVEAREDSRDGRNLIHRAEMRDPAGKVFARSKGRFVAIAER